MGRSSFIDLTAWASILGWIGGSIALAMMQNWPLFQSFGALGICIGVTYFVVQRHGTPHPHGAIEAGYMMQRQLVLLADAVGQANASIALLAKALVAESDRTGQSPNEVISSLANVSLDHVKRSLIQTSSEINPIIKEIESGSLLANSQVQLARRNSEVLQATIVVLGTLQGGFGQFLQRVFS